MGYSLPVLLYHHVNEKKDPIGVHPATFEAQLAAMRAAGWRGIGLDEARDYFLRGARPPKKSCLITFDDGFLDNYVHAWPLLQKHGHKAVVFAVTDRLETEKGLRPTLADAWAGRAREDELPATDVWETDALGWQVRRDPFFSWDEARAMEASGVIEVHAHSTNHASVFATGPEGLAEAPVPFWPTNQKRSFECFLHDTPFGLPRFPEGSALATRGFVPSEELLALVRERVPQEPEAAQKLLRDDARRAEHFRALRELPAERWGAFEDEATFRERVRRDLAACKEVLERELGGTRDALCWPWGASDPVAEAEAADAGFTLLFTTKNGANPPGAARSIHRFKVRDNAPPWLMRRLSCYARPLFARLYSLLKG